MTKPHIIDITEADLPELYREGRYVIIFMLNQPIDLQNDKQFIDYLGISSHLIVFNLCILKSIDK